MNLIRKLFKNLNFCLFRFQILNLIIILFLIKKLDLILSELTL